MTVLVVYRQTRNVPLARASSYYDVIRRHHAAVLSYTDGMRVLKDSGALDVVHAVLAKERRDTLGQATDDGAAAVNGLSEVRAHLADANAVVVGVPDDAEHLGISEKGLGGNAPPVEADTAKSVPLHDRRLHAQLSGANSGYISPRT